jgi:Tol biopolymer transport system component
MELKDESWIMTKGSPFRGKPWYHFYTNAPDGKTVYFAWRGSLDNDTLSSDINIWMVKKGLQDWYVPTKLPSPLNSESIDTCPSVTNKGTLYFFSRREGGFGKGDIYRSISNNGRYIDVENLGQTINTEYSDIDPFIAADESYLIFCSNRPGGFGGLDFYIAYQMQEGSWTEPVNMGEGINSSGNEERPYVSPDGKYLFLTRDISGNLDIYWVDAGTIEDLKPKDLN